MPFPKRLTAAQIVGLILMLLAAGMSFFSKDTTVRFTIYLFSGVGLVLIFNEPLKNASLKKKLPGESFTISGSVVLALVLILWDPIGSFKKETEASKTITIQVHGKSRSDDLIMKGHGSVIMHINGADPPEPIDYRGSAKFSNLRIGDSFRLGIMDSEPFMVRKPDSVYFVGDQDNISLEVFLKGIDRIFGYVRYNDRPLSNVHVSFDMIDTLSDSLGRFALNIPEYLQRQKYTVNFDKAGFKSKTGTSYPESDQPLSIILEK